MSGYVQEKSSWTLIGNDSSSIPEIWNDFICDNSLNVLLPKEQSFCFTNKSGFYVQDGTEEIQKIFADTVVSVCHSNTCIYLCLLDGKVLTFSMDAFAPVPHTICPGLKIVQVACGSEHVLYRTNTGDLYAEGNGPSTGLDEDRVFNPKFLRSNVEFVAAGEEHSLAIVKMVSHEGEQKRKRPSRTKSFANVNPELLKMTSSIASDERWGTEIVRNLLDTKRLGCERVRSPLETTQRVKKAEDDDVFYSSSASSLPEISTQVLVWGRGADYRLGLNSETDCPKPQELKELNGQNVVAAACGRKHSVAASVSGKLFIWGTPFDGQLPLKVPKTIPVSESHSILNVEAGHGITMVTINSKNDGPSLCRVLPESNGPKLDGIEVQPHRKLQTSVVEKDRCIAVFRSAKDWTTTLKVYTVCHTWSRKVAQIIPLPNRRSVKEGTMFDSAFSELCEHLTVLCRSTVALVKYLTLRTLRLHPFELLEPTLLDLLKNQIEALENFWIAAYTFDGFNGFLLLEKLKILSGSNTSASVREKFMVQSPMLSEAMEIVKILMELSKDEDAIGSFVKRIEFAEKIRSKRETINGLHKVVMKYLPKEIVMILYENDSFYTHITPNFFKTGVPLDRLKSTVTPITLLCSEDCLKTDATMLCLGSKNLVLIRRRMNSYERTIWPLSATWILPDRLQKLNIHLPDATLSLTSGNADDVNSWKFAFIDAINGVFHVSEARLSDARNWDKRKMTYTFKFGTYANCTYDGEWNEAKMDGVGELKGPLDRSRKGIWDSFKYYGEFRSNERDGLGINWRVRNKPPMSEIESGYWSSDHLHGFGIIEKDQQRSLSLASSGRMIRARPQFVGNFVQGKKQGFGFENGDDGDKYAGLWQDDMKHGAAVILTFKGHAQGSIVDCEFENDRIKCVSGKVNDNNFRYEGNLDDQKLPKGQGKFSYNITPNIGLIIEGDVCLSTQDDGKILVNRARVTHGRVQPEAQDTVFLPEATADSTKWQSLVRMCRSALLPAKGDVMTDERELAMTIWKKKIKRFLCSESSGLSREDINYYVDLSGRTFLFKEDKQKMIDVMLKLCELPASPISAFLRLRLEVMQFLTGVQVLDQARLQELVLQELSSLLLDLYDLARLLFPALPKEWKERVFLTGSPENLIGMDFAYSFLSDDSAAFAVLADVLDKACIETDRSFAHRLEKFDAQDDEEILKDVQIHDKKLHDALVRCLKRRDEENMILFNECVKKVDECFGQGVHCCYSCAIKVLENVDALHDAITNFLKKLGFGNVGADDLWPFLFFLVVKAKPKKLTFCISFVEKITAHNRSSMQTYYLTSFFTAYTANARAVT